MTLKVKSAGVFVLFCISLVYLVSELWYFDLVLLLFNKCDLNQESQNVLLCLNDTKPYSVSESWFNR